MRVEVQLAEVLAVLVERAGLVPALGDARVVLPRVEQLQVLRVLPVDDFEREVLVELRDVAAVADGTRVRFGLPRRVHGVDRLLGEFHRELLVLGHRWILGDGLPGEPLGAVAYSPDRPRACWRSGSLPECASQDQQVAVGDTVILHRPPWSRVLDCKSGGKQFLTDHVLPRSLQSQSEVLDRRMCEVNSMNDVPDLCQRWSFQARPFKSRLWASVCSGPSAVVIVGWALFGGS